MIHDSLLNAGEADSTLPSSDLVRRDRRPRAGLMKAVCPGETLSRGEGFALHRISGMGIGG